MHQYWKLHSLVLSDVSRPGHFKTESELVEFAWAQGWEPISVTAETKDSFRCYYFKEPVTGPVK